MLSENRIRVDHLKKMTEFTLEKLIPMAGERLDFLEKVQSYTGKEEHTQVSCH